MTRGCYQLTLSIVFDWMANVCSWLLRLLQSCWAVLTLLLASLVVVGELAWDKGDDGVGVREGDDVNEDGGELPPFDEFSEELDGNEVFSSMLLLLEILLLLLLLVLFASSCSLDSLSACFWARNLVRFSIVNSACYKVTNKTYINQAKAICFMIHSLSQFKPSCE